MNCMNRHLPDRMQARTPSALRPATPLRAHPTRLALAAALAGLPAWAAAQGLPTAPAVVSGNATITRPAVGQMTVSQGTQNAIINWQSFSVGAGAKVQFNQPNAQSVTLNRVLGSEPSSVLGSLAANGRIFLVNPNGVLFGAGANVSVGGLVASSLNIADADFNAGRLRFTRGSAEPASVVNDGSLQAAPGGVLALLGSSVANHGSMSAPQGTAALAAGKTVTLDLHGDGLTQLRITEADLQALAANSGLIAADGGRVAMLADATQASGFVVNQSGIVRARSMTTHHGQIVLGGGAGDVNVAGTLDASGGAGLGGGSIDVSGRNVGVLAAGSRLDASGEQSGGAIQLTATAVGGSGGVVAVAQGTELLANAGSAGPGGSLRTDSSDLHFHGSAQARGGAAGGDGGHMKITASGGVDLLGARVDFSATRGRAGTWDIDPFDIQVVTAAPLPPAVRLNSPFTAVANSYVLAADISAALNNSTDVSLSTGSGGAAGAGFITIVPGVAITRSTGAAPVLLRFNANKGLLMDAASIVSTAGPVNVDFNADSTAGAPTPVVWPGQLSAAITLSGATLGTAGGSVRFFGQSDAASGVAPGSSAPGVNLNFSTIDTRGAGGDGNVSVRATATGNVAGSALRVGDSRITTGAGAITFDGRVGAASDGDGVSLSASQIPTLLSSTSGALSITGLGQQNANSAGAAGVRLAGGFGAGVTIQSDIGAMTLTGRADGTLSANAVAASGVLVGPGAQVVATAAGAAPVLINGESGGGGYGVFFAPALRGSIGGQVLTTARNVVVRAGNDGTADAVSLYGGVGGAGVLQSSIVANAAVVNLRPGRVSTTGVASDDASAPIGVATGGAGFDLSALDLLSITGARGVVIGSDVQTGAITAGALTRDSDLTLQGGTANITIDRGVLDVGATHTLGLLTAGRVAAVSGFANSTFVNAGVRAATLVLQAGGSGGADVSDVAANNIGTLAADTGGSALNYQQTAALAIGTGTATGFAAGAQADTSRTVDGVRAGTGLVRTGGRLTLSRDVIGDTLDLVTATTLDNTAGRSINASTRWRVWADTWVGEVRGGLAGSGTLPNLYGCSYAVACSLTPAAAANTFIYARRPTLTVTVDNKTRVYGDANPAFTLSANGLINGDLLANVLSAAPATAATPASSVGNYAITSGTVASLAGYLLTVVNGSLAVTPRALTLTANDATRLYGDPNPLFTGSATGLAAFDNVALIGLGFSTTAVANSAVGGYAITPALANAALAANYALSVTPGTLAVTPSPLTYVANPATRTTSQLNPVLSGTVAGFKASDTQATATSGTLAWSTPAVASSDPGLYAVNGSGLVAGNYVFVQAAGNASALTVTGPSARDRSVALRAHDRGADGVGPRRLDASTYVYDQNLGLPQVCVPDAPLDGDPLRRAVADLLATEWSRLRSRPNVTTCFDTGRKNDCADF